jgi:hypothetical protein
MDNTGIIFSEENIRKIFGSYDGEGENINRLSQYYLKTDIYESTISNVPVKILVGSKGVGKSALFRIAIKEKNEQGKLSILIKPDDIAEIGEKHESLMISIRKWKNGLAKIIIRKVLEEFELYLDESINIDPIKFGGKIFPLLRDTIAKLNALGQHGNVKLANLQKVSVDNPIEIYLDDLDRGWQNRKEGLIMISALINSIRDMSQENEGLIFKLALRSDVYSAVRTEDESADKFEGLVTHYSYKLHEIYVLLIKRILTFNNESFDENELRTSHQRITAHYLNSIFSKTFNGRGDWEDKPMYNVLLSLIRSRPRDLIKLCTMAAKEAYKNNSNIIDTKHIVDILEDYSKSIINDTIAEYKSELPSIDRLIYGMKPNKKGRTTAEAFYFTPSDLRNKLYNLSQSGQFIFASGKVASPQELISFLFKIGFLTATKTKNDGKVVRKTFEQASQLSSAYLDFGFNWEVHMAYRWAIQPDTLDDVWATI